MTSDELDELIKQSPVLFHMAEQGSWPSIAERGLLSTTALLDLYKVSGAERYQLEESHRPESVTISSDGLPQAVIRDQKPMSDAGLIKALPNDLSPREWYKTLNSKVFFWLTEARLNKLLGARAYRNKEHDVLEIDTARIIRDYKEKIWLCPINSGCTKPFPHPRDRTAFSRISDYPYSHWASRRPKGERVVELCVDHSVSNISDYVLRVTRRMGVDVVGALKS